MEESEKQIQELQFLIQKMEESIRRRVCNNDCVSCVISMICENNKLGLGVKFCCPQSRTIISLNTGPKFEPKHLKCAEYMDPLIKCSMVKK